MEKENELRREAEEEEKRGRRWANEGDFVVAEIAYKNAKRLWEKIGDLERVAGAQKNIERMEELWKWRKEVE